MNRQILLGCLPYLAWLAFALAALWLLLRTVRARPDWRHLRRLPSDQRGAVQSLSFVLTVPLFVMIMLFIVQLSQLTMARVSVEYSAFAAVRAAQVWIPAHLGPNAEASNQIGVYQYLGDMQGEDGWKYARYRVMPGSPKFEKIKFAAVLGCMPVAPSRDVGADASLRGNDAARSIQRAALIYAPNLAANPRFDDRIRNKLAYALANTEVDIEFRHKENEPPLQTYLIEPYPDEFLPGEMGWHDQVLVTVTHHFALLPGPGRLLARRTPPYGSGSAVDPVADRIQSNAGVYVYSMTTTARLYNEGQKSRMTYVQPMLGPSTSLAAAPLGNAAPSLAAARSYHEWDALDPVPTTAAAAQACCDEVPDDARTLGAVPLDDDLPGSPPHDSAGDSPRGALDDPLGLPPGARDRLQSILRGAKP